MYCARPILRTAAFALFVALVLPSLSAADAGRVGNSFPVMGGGSRRSDVAYDPTSDVYLVVNNGPGGSPGTINGRFIQGDGTVLGNTFKIPSTLTHCQSAHVVYDPDLGGFLVIWLDTRADQVHFTAQVWARLLKFTPGGTSTFVTDDFMVDNATGGVQPETPPSAACAAGRGECLVAWQQHGGAAGETLDDIHAVRINATNGAALSGEMFLTADNNYQSQPAIAYDPVSAQYLVAFSFYSNSGNFAQLWVQRVAAGGGPVGALTAWANSGGIYVPDVAVNRLTNQFFVTWYDATTITYYGRYVGPDGTLGAIAPLLAGYGGYDAWGLAYNDTTGTFMSVTHGLALDDIGLQILGSGLPQTAFNATAANVPKTGNFNPRVAASAQRGEWLMSTSTDFVTAYATRLSSTERSGVDPGGPPPPPPVITIDLSPTGAPNGSWFLAEGAANASPNGFKTFYLVENPNPVDVNVRAYFSNDAGVATIKNFTVPRLSRTTVPLYQTAGAGSFGAVFQSMTTGADIEVERSMYWGPNLEGSTDATASKALSTVWYFAEGSRGGELFNNYFMLFNPTQTATLVTGHYYRSDGQVFGHSYNVGPQQRYTVDANIIPELAGADFSATFTSAPTGDYPDGVPIVAERAMYWDWRGDNMWIGGHGTMGAPALNYTWYFAEGNAAANFETFYLLLNPNSKPITVTADFMTEFSGRIIRNYTIPPNTRYTVYVNGQFGNIGPTGVAFSTPPGDMFLAERSIYWGNRVEGTNTIGSPVPAAVWDLPEGSTTGSFDTYTMLMNPNDHPVTVNVTVLIEGLVGQPFTLPANSVVLPAFSRLTLGMRDVLNTLQSQSGIPIVSSAFATRVATINGEKIVAEHAIYWNFVDSTTYWRSGGATMGIPH